MKLMNRRLFFVFASIAITACHLSAEDGDLQQFGDYTSAGNGNEPPNMVAQHCLMTPCTLGTLGTVALWEKDGYVYSERDPGVYYMTCRPRTVPMTHQSCFDNHGQPWTLCPPMPLNANTYARATTAHETMCEFGDFYRKTSRHGQQKYTVMRRDVVAIVGLSINGVQCYEVKPYPQNDKVGCP